MQKFNQYTQEVKERDPLLEGTREATWVGVSLFCGFSEDLDASSATRIPSKVLSQLPVRTQAQHGLGVLHGD